MPGSSPMDTQLSPQTPTSTMSGIPLAPVYGPAPAPAARRAGRPAPTRTRAACIPEMYRTRLWTMRMFAGFGSPEDTNQRFRDLLAQGQTGLSTAFDMPALMGYDPDHPMSAGEVGREGVSATSADDFKRLYDGIDLDAVSVSMTISGPAPVALALFVAAAEERGFDRRNLSGTLQTDILKEYIAQREWIVPERPGMRLVGDLIEFCSTEMPRWHPVSISGYHIREAGSTAAQELAFTIADGVAYVEELVGARASIPTRFLPRFSFFFNCHSDFFEEIAKLRAARRLWARADARPVRREGPALVAAAHAHADLGRVADGAAAAHQHRAHGHRGAGRHPRRHAVAAHQLLRRDVRHPDARGGHHRAAHAADPGVRDRRRERRRPARRLVVRRAADRRDGGPGGRLPGRDRPPRRHGRGRRAGLPAVRDRRGRLPLPARDRVGRARDRRRQRLHRSTRRRRSTCTGPTPTSSAASWSASRSCAPGATRPGTPPRWPRCTPPAPAPTT